MYKSPTIEDIGSLLELTQQAINIPKIGTAGDTIVIYGQSIPVPGSQLAP